MDLDITKKKPVNQNWLRKVGLLAKWSKSSWRVNEMIQYKNKQKWQAQNWLRKKQFKAKWPGLPQPAGD